MNVLSYFDGISCGQIALERAGLEIENYFACEIKPHAIKVTQTNYPNTIQLGDVRNVKIKLLCLSEVYSYLCTHDTDLQSKISEQEVLHWLNEKYTISTDFRTQKQNEGQAVWQPSTLQCFEKIRISKCGMGGFIKTRNIIGSGIDGDKTNIRNPIKLQCSEWWYGDDIQRGDKEKNITGAIRQAQNGNLKGKISRRKRKEVDFKENEKSDVDKGGEKELFGRSEENKLNGKVGEEKGNGGIEANGVIENLISKLQSWDETNGTSETYRDFIRLHSQEQITVVEYAGGLKIFKGKFDLLCAGSPCKGISRLNKNQEGLEHHESKLFWVYVETLEKLRVKNPNIIFLLENTHGNKDATNTITEFLGVKPISINSKLVSAQNRPRYYWTNIPNITQPIDKGITTKDVFDYTGELAHECRVKWLTNESGIKSIANGYTKVNPFPKSGCLTANGHRKWNENYLLKDGAYRYLSQTEIEKLQTLPIGYTSNLSFDDAYDVIGDGWTVDVIAYIFSFLKEGKFLNSFSDENV